MLDPYTYRLYERAARITATTWRTAAAHTALPVFAAANFPTRIESIQELGQLLDTMQEGRFAAYMGELGGLSDGERGVFMAAARSLLHFQAIHFPTRPPAVPYDTLLAAMAAYTKILRLAPDPKAVLEIGPGAGYLSLFLSGHPGCHYAQVEACESFYLLQNMLNSWCYGIRHCEYAHLCRRPDTDVWCGHWPWWHIDKLKDTPNTFDIIIANANLLEFTPAALDEYLALAHDLVTPDGMLLAQCLGHGADASRLWPALERAGWAVNTFIPGGTPHDGTTMAVSNLVATRTCDNVPPLTANLIARPPARHHYELAELVP